MSFQGKKTNTKSSLDKWNQIAYSDFSISIPVLFWDTDNFPIIFDSFMTEGEEEIHSYWDLGKIPTFGLFHIGW